MAWWRLVVNLCRLGQKQLYLTGNHELKTFRFLPPALLIALISTPAAAERGPLATALGAPDNLTITAGMRTRFEAFGGQFRRGRANSDEMLSLKTTLAAEYDGGDVFLGGEIWDARTYGQDRLSSAGATEVNALELIQAYVGVKLGDQTKGAKSGHGKIMAGRFTLDIGSRRLVSRQRYRNNTNAYTGVFADWTTSDKYKLQLLWSMPQIRLPEDANGIRNDSIEWDQETTDLQFFGAHLTMPKMLGGVVEAYGFGLREKDSPGRLTRNRRLWTVGARAFRKPAKGKWDHDVEAAYQLGKARRTTAVADRTDLDVDAWFAHAEFGYGFATKLKPRLSLHMDVASGDKRKPGKFGRFDTLYGARRFEFGPTSLYGPLGRANIVSPGVRVDITPSKTWDAFVMARAAWAESRRDSFSQTGVVDAQGRSGRFGGYQVETRVRYWIVPERLQIDSGAAWLAKSSLLKNAPNAPATGDSKVLYLDLILSI